MRPAGRRSRATVLDLDASALHPCHDRTAMRVCALGDLLLDVVARLDRPLVTGADTPAHTLVTAGGQAANVAAWAAALGADARLVAKRADDESGHLAATAIERLGVELRGPVATGETGIVVSAVSPDGERSMASDRGVSADLRPGRDRLGLVRRLRPPPRLRLLALRASPGARRRTARRRARARRRRDSERRSLVLERDRKTAARRRSASSSRARRPTSSSATRTRIASSAGRFRTRRGFSSGAPAAHRSTATSERRFQWRSSTRPVPATRSPPAGSSAEPISRSKRPPAASQPSARCPAGRLVRVPELIQTSDEVATALAENAAVVALETTLVAHGFPAPEGVAVGLESERRVRAAGAVPATVGVLDGAIRVGLDRGRARAASPRTRARSGHAISPRARCRRAVGATTVGGTARRRARPRDPLRRAPAGSAASTAAFPAPPDVSADLGELARAHRRSSSPPASSRFSTSRRRSSCWRRSESPCSASAPTRCRSSTRRTAGRPSRRGSRRRDEAARVPPLTGSSTASAAPLPNPPPESIDVEPLIEEAVAAAARQDVTGQA